MPDTLIIYHDNCVDGFAAAWVAQKYSGGKAELYPAKYGDTPPRVTNRDVLIVDFSYPRSTLQQMYDDARSLHVIDHHKSAQADLEGLNYCTFDMERSGAGLTWDALFCTERPPFIDYIEDRDLWRFKLPNSKAVNAFIGTCDRTIERYNALECMHPDGLCANGEGALAWLEHYARETCKLGVLLELFHPQPIPVWCVNCSPVGVSETCNEAIEQGLADVAMGWYAHDGRIKCSLRSNDKFDVSLIAAAFGGGGHAKAAGFAISMNDLTQRKHYEFATQLLRGGK